MHRVGLHVNPVTVLVTGITDAITVGVFRAVPTANAEDVIVQARAVVARRRVGRVVVARRGVGAAQGARSTANAALVQRQATSAVTRCIRVKVARKVVRASQYAVASAIAASVEVQAPSVVARSRGIIVARHGIGAACGFSSCTVAALVVHPKTIVALVANAIAIHVADAHPVAVVSWTKQIFWVLTQLGKWVGLFVLRNVVARIWIGTLAEAFAFDGELNVVVRICGEVVAVQNGDGPLPRPRQIPLRHINDSGKRAAKSSIPVIWPRCIACTGAQIRASIGGQSCAVPPPNNTRTIWSSEIHHEVCSPRTSTARP